MTSPKTAVLWGIGLAVVLTAPASTPAQKYEGVAVRSGQATLQFDGRELAFKYVDGGFQQVQGFTLATLVFRPEIQANRKSHLNLTLMYQAPGKVDLDAAFSTSGIALFMDGDVSQHFKGKSRCTITLTKATPTDVEGTADCPLVHNLAGEVMAPFMVKSFSATTR